MIFTLLPVLFCGVPGLHKPLGKKEIEGLAVNSVPVHVVLRHPRDAPPIPSLKRTTAARGFKACAEPQAIRCLVTDFQRQLIVARRLPRRSTRLCENRKAATPLLGRARCSTLEVGSLR